MKIDVCSDLHIDNWWQRTQLYTFDGPQNRKPDGSSQYIDWKWHKQDIESDATVLLIAGDLSNGIDKTVDIVKCAAEIYDHVLFVDGNHEHYNRLPYTENIQRLADAANSLQNVEFLSHENSSCVIDNIGFVGLNGWYDWRCYTDKGLTVFDARQVWRRDMNDIYIQFDGGDPDSLADRDATALASIVKQFQDNDVISKIVVMTHTMPSVDLAIWRDHTWNHLTPSFINSQMKNVLLADVKHKIDHWIYGHTHTRNTKIIDGITYVNNCRGYRGENPGWSLQQIEI